MVEMNVAPSSYILAVSRYKSISKAADSLGISQPALSAHIKKIETQLGITIFDRSQKPLELTEAGALYMEYTRRALDLDKSFLQHLCDLQELRYGKLSVGGASFFNVSYLPRAIAVFTKRYPGIDIEVIDGKMPEIIRKALNNEIDLFISPSWRQDDRFCYEKLLSEKIFLCVPQDWPVNRQLRDKRVPKDLILSGNAQEIEEWGKKASLDFRKLKDEPFILLKEEQHIGSIMARLFEKYDFQPKRFISAEQTMTSYALTLAGAGISLTTESSIRNSHFKDYPAFYLAEPEICSRDMYVAYAGQRYLSRAGREFIRVLKESLSGEE